MIHSDHNVGHICANKNLVQSLGLLPHIILHCVHLTLQICKWNTLDVVESPYSCYMSPKNFQMFISYLYHNTLNCVLKALNWLLN